jgi:DNA topoisomerase IB
VHPAVLEYYLSGKLQRRIQRKIEAFADEIARETDEELLRKEERAVMDLLQEYLEMKRK